MRIPLIDIRHRTWALYTSVMVTLFATFFPFPAPDGFTAPRYTLDPLLGVKAILGMDTGAWDVDLSRWWAVGNFFLLWPLCGAIVSFVSKKRAFVYLVVIDVSIEIAQGLLTPLGRTFEISDILSNLLGAAVLLLLFEKRSETHSSISSA